MYTQIKENKIREFLKSPIFIFAGAFVGILFCLNLYRAGSSFLNYLNNSIHYIHLSFDNAISDFTNTMIFLGYALIYGAFSVSLLLISILGKKGKSIKVPCIILQIGTVYGIVFKLFNYLMGIAQSFLNSEVNMFTPNDLSSVIELLSDLIMLAGIFLFVRALKDTINTNVFHKKIALLFIVTNAIALYPTIEMLMEFFTYGLLFYIVFYLCELCFILALVIVGVQYIRLLNPENEESIEEA